MRPRKCPGTSGRKGARKRLPTPFVRIGGVRTLRCVGQPRPALWSGSLEVAPFASPGCEASAIDDDNPPIVGGDSCAKGDCICPDDHDYEGVIRGLGAALVGNGAVGAADLLALLANRSPWRRQGEMGWVGFEPTSNRL